MLRSAENESIIDTSVLHIMEGALKVSDQQAREIMIPRSQMVVIEDDFQPGAGTGSDYQLPALALSGGR